jgi:uroporphyrinogen decarboxylase
MRPDITAFINALRRRPSPYVPLAELGVHPSIKERFIGRPVTTLSDEIEFWHSAGYDYVKLQPAADFDPGNRQGDARVRTTPEGTLRKWASEGKGVITSRQEFEAYPFPLATDFSYSRFEEVRSLLPDGMGVIGQYGDIFTMTWEMMGFETFSLALFEQPELVGNLNQTVGSLVVSMFEYFAESRAVDVLWYSDDIAYASGLMVSPTVLHKYFFPWLKMIGNLAKSHGKPLIYHTDGDVRSVLNDIIDCGVDALHPIEPKAMSLAEVKKTWGNRLSLIGHVDVDLLSRGTPAQVRATVRRNLDITGRTGYIIGSGNSIPEYVKFENYLAMLQAAHEFGGS